VSDLLLLQDFSKLFLKIEEQGVMSAIKNQNVPTRF